MLSIGTRELPIVLLHGGKKADTLEQGSQVSYPPELLTLLAVYHRIYIGFGMVPATGRKKETSQSLWPRYLLILTIPTCKELKNVYN